MSYEVIIPDRIHNTGLDGEHFPTREEAELALRFTRDMHAMRDDEAEILPRKEPPTTTFAEWNKGGW